MLPRWLIKYTVASTLFSLTMLTLQEVLKTCFDRNSTTMKFIDYGVIGAITLSGWGFLFYPFMFMSLLVYYFKHLYLFRIGVFEK